MLTKGAFTYTKSGLDEMLVSPESDVQEHHGERHPSTGKGTPDMIDSMMGSSKSRASALRD